jgi:TolA-binding protein
VRAEALLDEGANRSTVADRIWLEEHLEKCDGCRSYAKWTRGLHHLVDDASRGGVGELARHRMTARALDARASGRPPMEAARSRLFARVGTLALGVAFAAAALVFWSTTTRDRPSPDPMGESTRMATLPAGERATFGHAQIETSRETELRWEAPTLHVERGAISVAVDPSTGGLFRVQLPEFVVEVIGTRFDVDERGVRVHEGRVRIREVEGLALRATLGPGESYRHEAAVVALDPKPSISARVGSEPQRRVPDGSEPNGSEEDPELKAQLNVEQNPSREATPPSRSQRSERAERDDESVSAELAQARTALAQGAADRAEAIANRALRRAPRRSQAAEAQTILAEAVLVRGDLDRAAQLHLAVARAYPDLVAGETALFSAARLYTRAGMRSRGVALFEEYLERHPDGPFAAQARRRVTHEP